MVNVLVDSRQTGRRIVIAVRLWGLRGSAAGFERGELSRREAGMGSSGEGVALSKHR